MEIQPNLNAAKVSPLPADRPTIRRSEPAADQVVFSDTAALEAAVQALPELRVEKLQEAMKAIGDPAYPPEETMRRMAHLLAMHWPPNEV
jgi:hypothetical protein